MKNKPDIVCETGEGNMIIIVTYQPLEAWLSIQVDAKATSLALSLDQVAHLLNIYFPREFPVFQEWRAEHDQKGGA